MAKPTTVPITAETNAALIKLKAQLHAAGMKGPTNPDVVEGLILGAARSPIEAVKAVIETHVAAEGTRLLAQDADEGHEASPEDPA